MQLLYGLLRFGGLYVVEDVTAQDIHAFRALGSALEVRTLLLWEFTSKPRPFGKNDSNIAVLCRKTRATDEIVADWLLTLLAFVDPHDQRHAVCR